MDKDVKDNLLDKSYRPGAGEKVSKVDLGRDLSRDTRTSSSGENPLKTERHGPRPSSFSGKRPAEVGSSKYKGR